MPKNADEKRDRILEIAKKRFAHYGMAKTTMAEIAKDLSLSKALLYYYFPDKNSLYAAVLEQIIDECQDFVESSVKKAKNVDEAINIVLDKSMEFKKKYFYILEFTIVMRKDLPADLEKFIVESFEGQMVVVKNILDKGIEKGELRVTDTEEAAKLLIFGTLGLRMSVIKDIKSDFIPAKSEFDEILAMQKRLAAIFIRGLKV